MRPTEQEYAPFYGNYIKQVEEESALAALESSGEAARTFLKEIPEGKADFRYASEKWTVKELLQHMIDTERIMGYRALCVARNDKTALPGFDENAYVEVLDMQNRTLDELRKEFTELRNSTISMFRGFTEEAMQRQGSVSGNSTSVRALAFIIAGHQLHHFKILKERYL